MITQALQCSSRAAVVSYSYITDRVEMLAKFLRLDIRTFSFETPEQIEDTVKQCARAGYDLIVGGAATRDYAVAEGVQFLLITSSRESVEASIQQAIEQHHLINDVLDKNRLFQSVIDKSGSAVFIFGEQRELQYTNVAARKMLNDVERMEQFLSRGISTLQDTGTLHLIKKLNNDFYEITGGILQVRQEIRYLFDVHFRSRWLSGILLRQAGGPGGHPPGAEPAGFQRAVSAPNGQAHPDCRQFRAARSDPGGGGDPQGRGGPSHSHQKRHGGDHADAPAVQGPDGEKLGHAVE